jgi:hypothetical protein
LSWIAEVRDFDGMPVVVRVRAEKKGIRIEAWGVRGGRDDMAAAMEWERQLTQGMEKALPGK